MPGQRAQPSGGSMLTYDEYRQFADACNRWAQNAKSEEARRTFLEMAVAWTDLSAKALTRASGQMADGARIDVGSTSLY
jgi:hypothetical protein